jgi:threonine aldolase
MLTFFEVRKMRKRWFASDNNSGVHADIMKSLEDANSGHAIAYGDDQQTENAICKIKDIFGKKVEPFFVFNGTAANVLGLKAALSSYNSVLCSDVSHIFLDECGAVEHYTGSQLITIPTIDGKITTEQIREKLTGIGVEHHSQPKVISISQVTEFGTVYTVDELKRISDFAHLNEMYLHVDGARLANAACSLGLGLKEITADVGVDILSFGGTKNGLMFGEVLIIFNSELASNFKYLRKQGMQLASKMRYISAQFAAYLSNDLWLRNAKHSNEMAKLLKDKLEDLDFVNITQKVDANAIFAKIPKSIIKQIQECYFFHVWNESIGEVRWMTSFDTTREDIDGFVEELKSLIKS